MRNKAEIALSALLNGHGVTLFEDSEAFYMGEGFGVGVKAGVTGEAVILPVDVTLKDFVVLCRRLPDEYIAGLATDLSLNVHLKKN